MYKMFVWPKSAERQKERTFLEKIYDKFLRPIE